MRLSELQFKFHSLRRDVSNFALLKHRNFDGFIVSMHQSGTHWLKYMLALALVEKYQLPPPRYNHANDIIGGPKDPRTYAQLPRLASSHSIPHALVHAGWFRRRWPLPRYLVLVRDMRASLVSNYEKWKQHYGVEFVDYLRGDPSGRLYNSDIWWCLRFMNAWGELAERYPEDTMVLRYEDLQHDPGRELAGVADFLRLQLSATHIDTAVAGASKQAMAQRHDPDRPGGEVSFERRDPAEWFGERERILLERVCTTQLRYTFGYDYARNASYKAIV